MPKSYLPDEPERRAPSKTSSILICKRGPGQSYQAVGHPIEKIELPVLGGTWSSYRKDYQEWFVRRCLDAMNEDDSETLEAAQAYNETAAHRNVGLVIETRPDEINPKSWPGCAAWASPKCRWAHRAWTTASWRSTSAVTAVAETLRACALLPRRRF